MRLVLEGGGVRAAYSAGVVHGLAQGGARFDAVIGSSSGSVNAAFFASGQTETLCDLWRHWVPGDRFISWDRQLSPWEGPGLGIDAMLDDVIVGRQLLDLQRATAGSPDLYLTATDVDRCENVVVKPTAANLMLWMKASLAIPVGYNRLVEIDGRRFVDGGMAAPVAFDCELETEASPPAVVILTRKMRTKKPPPSWWERFFIATIVPSAAREPSLLQHRLHNQVMQRLEAAARQGSALVIDPPDDMPLSRLTRDAARISAGIDMGIDVGLRLARRINEQRDLDSLASD